MVRMKTKGGGRPQLVILLALPRSGSTLTYQALIHSLKPLYLSNIWNLLYAVPWSGGIVSRKRCAGHCSDFRSSQGFVGGICGPAEGLRFWSYWTGSGLDDTVFRKNGDGSLERRVRYIHNVLTALTNPQSPMITGFLGHVLIFEQLRRWFPDVIFLRLQRDPLSNAASILRSRKLGSKQWFSVFPRECESVKGQGIHAEVAAQVYWLNRRLECLEQDERTVHLAYEDLCEYPNGVLRMVTTKCNRLGLDLSVQKDLPESFNYRIISPKESDDIAHLWYELQKLESEHGQLATPLISDRSTFDI